MNMKEKDGENEFQENTEKEHLYAAFISYRHLPLDKDAAERIQKKIETYVVPKEYRAMAGGRKLGHCFRDEDELTAASSLTDRIYNALDRSKYLIVICTPGLPESKWCEEEIRYFIQTHDRDHVLAVLADGGPEVSFSHYMMHTYDELGNITGDTVPLAANIAGPGHKINNKAFRKETMRLIAAMIGCPFDSLWQRERRARTNRLLSIAGAALAVMAVFLGVVLNRNAMIAERNRQIQEQNDEISSQYDQISKQNVQIEEQNAELQKRMSTALTESGRNRLEQFDTKGALTDAVQAAQSEDADIVDKNAELLLADSLGAYQDREMRCETVYEQQTDITDLFVTDDEKHVILKDSVGVIRCLDIADYSLLWEKQTNDLETRIYTKNLQDRLLYKTGGGLFCLSVHDGSLLWFYEHEDQGSIYSAKNYFQSVSDDGSIFAVMELKRDQESLDYNKADIVFLDTMDGTILGRAECSSGDNLFLGFSPKDNEFGSGFSNNNRVFMFAAGTHSKDEHSEYGTCFFKIDLNTFQGQLYSYFDETLDKYYYLNMTDPETETFFLAALDHAVRSLVTDTFRKDENGEIQGSIRSTMHVISDEVFFDPSAYNYHISACDYLRYEDRIFIFSDNEVFLFGITDNRMYQLYSLNGKIINAYWKDEENCIIEIICSDGAIINITFNNDSTIHRALIENIGTGDLIRACAVNGGLFSEREGGEYLAVSDDHAGTLLRVSRISDPNGTDLLPELEDVDFISGIAAAPDGEHELLIYNNKNVCLFEKKTGEKLKEAAFNDFFTDSIIPLENGESFLSGGKLYRMDGSTEEYAEPIVNENGIFPYESYPNHSIRLYDGRILSWNTGENIGEIEDEEKEEHSSSDSSAYLYSFWLDGKEAFDSSDRQKGLVCVYSFNAPDLRKPVADAGKNGLAMVYGVPVYYDESTMSISEDPVFRFINAANGKIIEMENPYPDSGAFEVAFAENKLWAAVVYEDGRICIFDLENEQYIDLNKQYSANEVITTCFSNRDKWLSVLTCTGELDIFETETFTSVFERRIRLFSGFEPHWTDDVKMHSEYSEQTGRLYVFAGLKRMNGIILDTYNWTLTAQIGRKCFGYDPDTDRIYKLGDKADSEGWVHENCRLISYQTYDLESLKEWAKKELTAMQ